MNVLTQFFFVAGLLITSPLLANTGSANSIDSLLKQAREEALAQAPYWLALGHYHPANNDTGIQSEVTSPSFFLAPQGAINPQQELEATLRAVFAPAAEDMNQHAQCRFIARYHWLKRQLDLSAHSLPRIQCDQFKHWSMEEDVDSISLVFATGFLDNPASFYGHLLLKFNSRHPAQGNELLDQSLNYGANVPPDENPFVYIFRGLLGGYDASFSADQFYRHNLVYGENELRDLWAYDLALNKNEVQQIMHHGWELLNSSFTYFFLKENCAYRMSELLELIIGQSLLPQDLPWSMPATVFDNLMHIEHRGQPLVRKVRLIPSRQNRFYNKYFALSTVQQQRLFDVVDHGLNLKQPDYLALPASSKIAVVDTLFDYYAFRVALEEDDSEFEKAKHQLLVERASLPIGKANNAAQTTHQTPPHKGPLPSLLRTGLIHSKMLGTGLELQLRPVYYDSLGIDSGRLPDSHLTMFDLRAVYRNKKLTLRSLDFINIQTLNVSRTGMPGDGGRAWSLRVGLDRHDLSCDSCSVLRVVAGTGRAKSLTRNTLLYGMLEGFAQNEYQHSGNLGVNAKIGLWTTPWSGWKSQLMIGTRKYANGSKQQSQLLEWKNRFGNNRRWDMRLTYEKQVESEISAAASLYW